MAAAARFEGGVFLGSPLAIFRLALGALRTAQARHGRVRD
jgi:hypothetical protein